MENKEKKSRQYNSKTNGEMEKLTCIYFVHFQKRRQTVKTNCKDELGRQEMRDGRGEETKDG